MQDYYLAYNLETRIPQTISGSPMDNISATLGYCLVHPNDGEDFILFKKNLNNYLVTVVNGYAEFNYKFNAPKYKKYNIPANVVQDLNYITNFVTGLDIKWESQDNKLTLTFDLSSLGADIRNAFTTSINANNGLCCLYITQEQNPFALIEKINFDIHELSKTKKQTFNINTIGPISVWAIRKK